MFKFIYSKKDEGIYRIRRIFGIKIVTKPVELKILCKLQDIENNLFSNSMQKELYKLEVYKIYANNRDSYKL
ncbi:hypothetical protein [Brachyspira pilosicoli]|uniref:hypothetical protein n=1 Tax=Brachyspira pilosicoli TaxID=52584 RepID=UPI0012F6A45B|nr:hypothetical protein [Brachyspira pilosicoli]